MDQDSPSVVNWHFPAFWAALIGLCLGIALAGSQYSLSTQTVTVSVDGISFPYQTRAKLVSDVLTELGISPTQFLQVTPALDSKTAPLMEITLSSEEQSATSVATRPLMPDFTVEYVISKIPVAFKTTKKPTSNLYKGTEQIAVVGKEGLLEQTRKIVKKDDQFVADVLLVEKVLAEPVNQVVLVGQKERVKTVATSSGTFRYREVREMLATAYYPGPECTAPYTDGFTAIGLVAGHGIVAVDPRVIPLRSRVYIPGYGIALAGDVGGAIKGNRVDLCYETIEEALQFGRKWVNVYILE